MKNCKLLPIWQNFLLTVAVVFVSFFVQSQLHLPVSCGSTASLGEINWSTTPSGSSEFNWTPTGTLTNSFTNISGTGVDATISFSGETGTFDTWTTDTPSVGTNPTDGASESLQMLTSGFNNGIVLKLDFSTPISEIAFDLAHVNALPGGNGDIFTITGVNELGQIVYPTITPSANPSYTFDAFGNIDANASSTAGDDDEVGIHLSDPNRLVSFTIFWGNCTTCTSVTHGLGIQDIQFCTSNIDGDLLGDHIDIDDDNDGIIDLEETGGLNPLADLDGDGVLAYLDDDDLDPSVFNNDAKVEEDFDFDGDNIPNHFDLDSDNDGIADIIEAGGFDANGDGEVDYPTIGNPETMTDLDSDGLSDDYDATVTNGSITLTEAGDCSGTTVNYNHTISFSTGTIDALSDVTLTFCMSGDYGSSVAETMTLSGESGAIGTYSKLDSDNPSYSDCDIAPMCIALTIPMADWNLWNNNGVVNFTVTPSASVNFCADYSCLSSMTVTFASIGVPGMTIPLYNSDLVGNPDYLDLDSDNDGIGDNIELNQGDISFDLGGGTTLDGMVGNGAIIDLNGNGWSDADEGLDARIDFDGDDNFDMLENDSDNDGIRDFLEGVCTFCPAFGDASNIDSDGDGFSDQYENLTSANELGGSNQGLNPNDHDGDGTPDYLDLDTDNDGGFDWTEGYDVNGDGFAAPEFETTAMAYDAAGGFPTDYPILHTDTDIVPNFADNQPNTHGYVESIRPPFFVSFSPSWIDNDKDGLVDLLDADIYGIALGEYAPLPNTDGIGDRDWRDVNTIVILPIELLSFTATPVEREVVLDWETATEKDVDYFVLVRSDDAQAWEEIGQVDAVGNSTSLSTYSWIDEEPLIGISYYRLKAVDIDFNTEYSQIEVVSREGKGEVLVYPNPTNEFVTVKADFAPESQVNIVSITGSVIQSRFVNGSESLTFDVSELATGCYYFSFTLSNGERATRKLVVGSN